MAFRRNSYEQIGLRETLLPLSEKEREALDKSWARDFADKIFPLLDETEFSVLFRKGPSKPNVPVNVLIGALLLKGFMGLSDEELTNAAMFDMRFQTALHTTGTDRRPFGQTTLSRFRRKCLDYERKTGIDLAARAVTPAREELARFAARYFGDSRFDFEAFTGRMKKNTAFSYSIVKNPEIFEENRLPAHSDHFCYRPDLAPAGKWSAAASDHGDTGFTCSLNGMWKFSYAANYRGAVRDFEKVSFDCGDWEEIRVPAHIQMEGWDRPAYVNYQYPWDGREEIGHDQIPERYNPVASYVRYFRLPAAFTGRPVYISFQGVESGFALWLNGSYVGYSEDSFTPSEFDLTPYLRRGENKLAVRVFKWTASSWLEDQDFFRFSGIFRDVYLYTVPEIHVRDLKITAVPEAEDGSYENTDGTLTAELELQGERAGCRIRYALSLDGSPVLDGELRPGENGEGPEENMRICRKVSRPLLWSAEKPCLYDLRLEVYKEDGSQDGSLQEVVLQKVGFRRFEMKNGIMCLNGKRIVFKGVNRHEFSCDRGRAIGREEALQDVITMKQNNINAVRTSHYPNGSALYRICDEYGIYMIAENNMEAHGSWALYESGLQDRSEILPGDHIEWQDMLLDRVESCYQRDKNHPAILIWSCGNESFGGSVIHEMAQRFRQLDPERLVHYEGIFHDRSYPDTSDMESQMYPSAASIEAFLRENPEKPFICCEYTHAMGNSNGGMHKYTDLADREPRYQGGFIWDFVDQSLRRKDRYGKEFQAYGGDSGERPTDYDFSGNGIVDGTRRPYAKMQEVRYNYQNIRAEITEDRIRIRNQNLFTNTEELDCVLLLEKEGCRLAEYSLETAAAPLSEQELAMPALPPLTDGEYVLTVSFRLRQDTAWAGAGHEVAFDQRIFTVTGSPGPARPVLPAPARLELIHGDFNIGIRGQTYDALFSMLRGGLASWRAGGRELIEKMPRMNFWRAPVSNDTGNAMAARYGQWKLASLYALPAITAPEHAAEADHNAELWPQIKEKKGQAEIIMKYLLPTAPAASAIVTYRFLADGAITFILDYDPVPGLSEMPEFGFLFTLNADYDQVKWYGMGPEENYCDRNRGAKLGVYSRTAAENMEAYLVPQETGNRTGVRWAEVTDRPGRGYRFESSLPDGMDFSAIPYTPEELEAASHPGELPGVYHTIVRCSLKQMGVGGDDSWGARTHEEYLLDVSAPLHFEVTVRAI